MAEIINKPNDINEIFAEEGNKVPLEDGKELIGWEAEVPLAENFNYYENRRDKSIAHNNQFGVNNWDTVTEYVGLRSYCTDATGRLLCAKVDSIGQDPVSDITNTYWHVVFDPATI